MSEKSIERKHEERKSAFEKIYDEGYWGSDVRSGAGSTLDATRVVREIILNILKERGIKTITDVACGDFTWMPRVLEKAGEDISYLGCDLVESIINRHKENYPQYSFKCLDIVEGNIPKSDLVICRDVLQHLPIKDIKKAINNISNSGSKYLLATTYLRRFGLRNKRNICPGKCRDRNLLASPFNLPDPIIIYSEQYNNNKFLCLWELPVECN